MVRARKWLPPAALAASAITLAYAQPAEPDIDEISVVGERSLSSLRAEMETAETDMYTLFNRLNDDDEFDVECELMKVTGSNIEERICMANYVKDAYTKSTRVFVQGQNNAGSMDPTPELENNKRRFADRMVELINEHPELLAAVRKFEQTQNAYRTAYEARFGD